MNATGTSHPVSRERGVIPVGSRVAGGLNGLSVKASLRLAFAALLIGTLAIGAFSLMQISRLNGSTKSIYEQGRVAS